MPRTHSKSQEVLKCLLAVMLLLAFMFSVIQFIVAEWTTAVLWLVASLGGMVALFAKNGKMVMGAMGIFSSVLFAAFICHIVFLSTINRHTDDSYPGQSAALEDSSWRTIKSVIAVIHILGLVFTILLSAFIIPTFLFLAKALKHNDRKGKGAHTPMAHNVNQDYTAPPADTYNAPTTGYTAPAQGHTVPATGNYAQAPPQPGPGYQNV